jgi:hypothetical protein
MYTSYKINRSQMSWSGGVNTVDQQCTNPRRVFARATKFCTMTPNIFSLLIAGFFPHLHTKMCISSHALKRKRQITVRFTGRPRTVGPQKWPRFHENLWIPALYMRWVKFENPRSRKGAVPAAHRDARECIAVRMVVCRSCMKGNTREKIGSHQNRV